MTTQMWSLMYMRGNMESTTDVDILCASLAAHRAALQALVEKLTCEKLVEGLKGVCMVAQLHGCSYEGPTWALELERAKDVLAQTPTS